MRITYYTCPFCEQLKAEMVTTWWRQRAMWAGLKDYMCLPAESRSFQVVCGGTNSSFGCGVSGPQYHYKDGKPSSQYRKSPDAAKNAALKGWRAMCGTTT